MEKKTQDCRILIVEDLPYDAELNQREIKNVIKGCVFTRVDTEDTFLSALSEFKPDIIITDFKMPVFDGLSALKIALNHDPNIPVIMVTGPQNEDIAVECMKAGATDYIIKGHYKRLGEAVRSALVQKEVKLEKERTEKNLHESEERLRLALSAANQGIIDLNMQTGEMITSPEYASMLGYIPGEFVETNEKWQKRLHPEDKERVGHFLQDYIDGRVAIYQVELRLLNNSGQWKWFLLSGKIAEWGDDGKPLRMLGTCIDITQQKMVEEELKNAWIKAEESDRLKTAFLHNISHEIRTPMNAIVGFSNLLDQDDTDPEKMKHYTEIIRLSSNQLLSIITDIINISTIEAGQERLVETELDINKLIQSLYNQYEYKIDREKINFSFTVPLPYEKAVIYTDEIKLTQIFSNLLTNAVKFTKSGKIEFGYNLNETFLQFYVVDTGIGVPPELHSEIFERFRQADHNISRVYGGTGLGLAISKSYVELMGGKIWLESESLKGSSFFFTMPYKPVTVVNKLNTESPGIHEKKVIAPKRLLIAEDDNYNYELIEEMLLGLNFFIYRANNGLEAVEICKQDPYIDIILMDIKMPVLNGYEATRQIRAIRPRIPIIALTAYVQQTDREKALASGCDEFISKPVVYDQLVSILIKFLEKQPE